MPCDLEVDTDQLRRAATLLRRAADEFGGRPAFAVPDGQSEHAAGGSAAGRTALRAILSSAARACAAAGALQGSAGRLGELLDRTAARFDAAEAACGGG